MLNKPRVGAGSQNADLALTDTVTFAEGNTVSRAFARNGRIDAQEQGRCGEAGAVEASARADEDKAPRRHAEIEGDMSATDVIVGVLRGGLGSSPPREDGSRRRGLRRSRVRQAFEGGEATHAAEGWAMAVRALGSWARRDGGSRIARGRTREPLLQPAQDGPSTAVNGHANPREYGEVHR